MSKNEENEEIHELSTLNRQVEPPPDLEDRVVTSLRKRGWIRSPAFMRSWRIAVAAVLLLAIGFAAGRASIGSAEPVQYSHVLLLREDSGFRKGDSHEASLVREYANWARGIARSGMPITGEKLAAASWLFRQSGDTESATSDPGLSGFFLLKAGSDAEAERITKQCPHLRYGGEIELRRIDTVD